MTQDITNWIRKNVLEMEGYVPGEQPQGAKFIKLNTNENPYRCSDNVIKAISDCAQNGLQKYPDPSAFVFRSSFGNFFGIDPDWILCGNGSDEILSMLFTTFVNEGDQVVWPMPTYVLYQTLARIQSGMIQTIPFESNWHLSEGFFEQRDRTKLVFLANPNSPSGTMLDTSQLERVVTEFDCPVVIDEAYIDFSDQPQVGLELVKRFDNVIVTRTLSKSYALAGLRFGWMVAQPAIIEQVNKIRDSYNCDALSISAASAAILDQQWLTLHNEKIFNTRNRLIESLIQLGFKVTPSQANFVWCTHPQTAAKELYEQLKLNQILVRYMSFSDFGDGLRITVGTDEQIEALISVLQKSN